MGIAKAIVTDLTRTLVKSTTDGLQEETTRQGKRLVGKVLSAFDGLEPSGRQKPVSGRPRQSTATLVSSPRVEPSDGSKPSTSLRAAMKHASDEISDVLRNKAEARMQQVTQRLALWIQRMGAGTRGKAEEPNQPELDADEMPPPYTGGGGGHWPARVPTSLPSEAAFAHNNRLDKDKTRVDNSLVPGDGFRGAYSLDAAPPRYDEDPEATRIADGWFAPPRRGGKLDVAPAADLGETVSRVLQTARNAQEALGVSAGAAWMEIVCGIELDINAAGKNQAEGKSPDDIEAIIVKYGEFSAIYSKLLEEVEKNFEPHAASGNSVAKDVLIRLTSAKEEMTKDFQHATETLKGLKARAEEQAMLAEVFANNSESRIVELDDDESEGSAKPA